jgi:hypothetical protein
VAYRRGGRIRFRFRFERNGAIFPSIHKYLGFVIEHIVIGRWRDVGIVNLWFLESYDSRTASTDDVSTDCVGARPRNFKSSGSFARTRSFASRLGRSKTAEIRPAAVRFTYGMV